MKAKDKTISLQEIESIKNRPVHYFTKEYAISGKVEKCRLISMKIEPSLLAAFKKKAELEGIPYQKKIKELMKNWL